ncbi:uncharacterized protein DUF1206 [Hoeflea marina]|uniref:Uncharacterized protein DUF1206 n=1 Tax=Hoeflea marina TaxID=274592 RepID=A0A317PVZ7_9HYPH|nr:DUF1206 domain-containing protein [Hoeflea marina]PWW04466.1 uncharacterized protein DUF1206 [Hoeflea marina]
MMSISHPAPRTWIEPLARMGYAARGVIYLIIGLFAFLSAIGSGEEKDSKDALQTLLSQPFGTILVWLLIAGLGGYVIWRLVQAVLDSDDHGNGAKALAIRAGLLVSALTYGTLAVYALSLMGVLSGGGSGGGKGKVADYLAGFVGSATVSLGLAVIMLGVAGAHVWKAYKRKYADHIDCNSAPMNLVHPVSIAGLTARGMVFLVIAVMFGYRFFNAADSSADPSLKSALQFVQDLPFGGFLLSMLGLGLIAFSAYSFAEARWRRIDPT